MSDSLLKSLTLDGLNAPRLWSQLDRDTRVRAAAAFYAAEAGKSDLRKGADQAIASTLKFRMSSMAKLDTDKKVRYLATAVRPDEALAVVLIQALHLHEDRRPMLGAFLDALEIKHEDGHIDEKTEFEPPSSEALGKAAETLYARFAEADVDVYLASLLGMESQLWGGLREVLARRAAGG